MINYEASAINSNVTLLQKMNKIEKYLLENQLGNVFVTYETLADDRLSDSDIQELNDRVIDKGDLLIDNDGYLYVITGFNEHTVYIDFAHRIKLGDRLDQAELDLIQQMIDDTFTALDPITITTNDNGVLGNEENSNTVAIGDSINLQDGTNPTAPSNSVFIGYDLGSTVQTGDTMYGESNVVIGNSSDVHGDQNNVIGRSSNVTGYRSTAIGVNAVVNADNAVQIGTGTNSNNDTLQFKTTQIVDGNGNIAVKAGGTTGQVLAKNSALDYDYTWINPADDLANKFPVNIGKENIGNTTPLSDNVENVLIGYRNNYNTPVYNTQNQVIIGVQNTLKKLNDNTVELNVVIGSNSTVEGNHEVVIGNSINFRDNFNTEKSFSNIGIGYSLGTKKAHNILIGNYNNSWDSNNIVIGRSMVNNGQNNIMISTNGGGHGQTITGSKNIFLISDNSNGGTTVAGNDNIIISTTPPSQNTTANNFISIGYKAKVNVDNACQIGEGTNTTTNSLQYRSTQIVDGNGKLNIPNGVNGTTGQVLTKLSNAENDYAWQTVQGGGGSGKTFDIPMLVNYTADQAFSSIMGTPTTIVIDDQISMQGLNLETSDLDFSNYENKTSIYGYSYLTSGNDSKVQLVYGIIAESSTPGTYEFTGLSPLAPEVTM